jgi:hypothetical protein
MFKIYLDSLPEDTEEINVSNKGITSLDVTRFRKLKILNCSNNQLFLSHSLPENLEKMIRDNLNFLYDSPRTQINNLIFNNNLVIINIKINILNKFRYLYYCLKFKKQFRYWLWEIVKKPIIENKFNPKYLIENIVDENTDLDMVLSNW